LLVARIIVARILDDCGTSVLRLARHVQALAAVRVLDGIVASGHARHCEVLSNCTITGFAFYRGTVCGTAASNADTLPGERALDLVHSLRSHREEIVRDS
jgi:hypothetical protein